MRAQRSKATGRHTLMLVSATATIGAAVWCGSGVAHAAPNYEQQACALMDDHGTAIHLGYSSYPSEYAFSVLSKEMPPLDAAHVLRAATRDVCPGHARDMPQDWQ
ncbi:hypothetical protein [Mycobacterium interjectum]|uniref:hypothetical protein n=1 Tax=Mycobacterium interjectum TaxID=33895 RepID=UPI00082C7214|nr:hypothetical protein [Mycobacterium interjectum]MCV7092065.1 hypothetical protein [Mycobacterium interjectum]